MNPARRTDYICVVIILIATLGVYSPALVAGKVLLPADIVPLMRPWAVGAKERFPELRFVQNQMHGPIFEYYSWRHYARERIRDGEVPLWNPYELGGNPLLANSQSAVLYPPNILLYLLPLWQGINWVTALHTFLTGLFLFLFLRLLKLSPPAALTGALIWMFCGLQIVWTEFQTPTAALCWLPAGLYCWERFAQSGGWRWAFVGCGSAIALTLLAGHLHFAFYVILAVIIYALWRAWEQRKWRSHLPALVGALGFGLLLSGCTILPVVELSRVNFRGSDTSYASSIALKLPPEHLLSLLQPNLFGNPRDYVGRDASGNPTAGNGYWGSFDFIEYCVYLGIPALVLAILGFRKRDQNSLFLSTMAALGLMLALGAPLCALFYYLVPGYKQFHATARALCLFSFGVSGLAAFGVQRILDSDWLEIRRAVGVVVGLVAVAGLIAFPGMSPFWKGPLPDGREVARLLTDQWFGYSLAGLLRFAVLLALAAVAISAVRKVRWAVWTLPALAAADLLVWGFGFNPVTNPAMLGYPTATTDFLKRAGADRVVSLETPGLGVKSCITPNYNAVVHLREVQGADSLHTRRYHKLIEGVVKGMDPSAGFPDPNTIHVPSVNHPFFDMMNVRYVTSQQPLDSIGYRKVADAELPIWENPNAYGPAWIVSDVRSAPPDRILEEVWSRQFDGRIRTFIEGPPPNSSPGEVKLRSFAPHSIEYEATLRKFGFLVASEINYPGWRATVDSVTTRVFTANYILRGIEVAPGAHKVTFQFDPASYRLGLYLTVLALAIAATAIAKRRQ